MDRQIKKEESDMKSIITGYQSSLRLSEKLEIYLRAFYYSLKQ
jgi:hypothetical protein